jgi:hypothetical protein
MATTMLIPSPDLPDAYTALERFLPGAVSVSAAIAFVTQAGAGRLIELARPYPELEVELCARAAPVTEQKALLRLRDELGASISLVAGQDAKRFHPKLWHIRSEDRLTVLAGSGNLTGTGLRGNTEQFDIQQIPLDSARAERHEARFDELVAGAMSLAELMESPAWFEWKDQIRDRERIQRELNKLDTRLASRKTDSRQEDKRLLCADLYGLYAKTVAAKLPRADGKAYIPHYYKRGLDNACAAGEPVPFVARLCKRQTEGFDVMLAAGERDLTVEALVMDVNKTYHNLFDDETRRKAQEHLDQF